MSKVIEMGKFPNGRVDRNDLKTLIQATQHRIPILKRLPKKLQYHFKVEKILLIEEWDKFYIEIYPLLESSEDDKITLSANLFHKSAYFLYFFGSFYKYNGDNEGNDPQYVAGVFIFLDKFVKFIDGISDIQELFYNAFPSS